MCFSSISIKTLDGLLCALVEVLPLRMFINSIFIITISHIWHRYYHFGVVKALLDANLLPRVITGTSGGALVAALLCTRTNFELKELLVPELATKITACHDNALVSIFPHCWLTVG